MNGGAWWAAVHGVAEGWTWLSDFTFTFHFHALEKEMATHSSVLAWRIPGTGEPGGLSMESQSRTRLKQFSSSSSSIKIYSIKYIVLLLCQKSILNYSKYFRCISYLPTYLYILHSKFQKILAVRFYKPSTLNENILKCWQFPGLRSQDFYCSHK